MEVVRPARKSGQEAEFGDFKSNDQQNQFFKESYHQDGQQGTDED